jgi:hypothetical protein
MTWDAEYTDEFDGWWASLTEDEQVSLAASVQLLEARGASLGHPHSSGIHGSRHGHMRELRSTMAGDLFARCTLLIRAEWLYASTWFNFDVKER